MDRNSVLGLILIGVILIGYSIYYSPSQKEIQRRQRKQDSIARVQQEKKQAQKQRQDSLERAREKAQAQRDKKTAERKERQTQEKQTREKETPDTAATESQLKDQYGAFYKGAKGEQEIITLENDVMVLKISTKGAKPYNVILKEYQRYDSTNIKLFDGDKNTFGFSFYAQNRVIATNDLYFKPLNSQKNITVDKSGKTVTFRLQTEGDRYIDYVYTLKPGSYKVDFDVEMKNMNTLIESNTRYLDLKWETYIPSQERGKKWEKRYSSMYYKFLNGDVDYLSSRSGTDSEELTTKIKWIDFKQQFFSSILIADNHFLSSNLEYEAPSEEEGNADDFVMHCTADITVPYKGNSDETIPMSFYFGPNRHKILAQHDLEFTEVLPLGWGIFGWVNKFAIIPMFNILGSFMNNYGLIILVMTIVIKIVLFPLTYKSYLSTAKMRTLKPQIDEINEKYPNKDDAMKKQQEQMALYKKAGVSPAGGCLPMLLQMPILIAMYRFFPASIELRQESFLWANDLSSYDSILELPFTIPFYGDHVSLFTLLMAATLLATTQLNSSQMSGAGGSQMPGMKNMMYIMPVILLFVFNNYSSGLAYYLLISNVFTLGQTLGMRKFVDEDKLMKKVQEKKKKSPPKKSNFQQRIEKMANEKGQGKKLPKK